MAIAVNCSCGKRFKVKDHLAGKIVRCPACKCALQIPAAVVGSPASGVPAPQGASKGKSSAPVVDKEAALRRYEEAQKRKHVSAEAEAAYRAEQNKLIESYDQLTGRTTAKGEKKKGQLTELKPKRVTIFTKIADIFGAVFATLIVRYLIIFVLLAGGVTGSVFLVRYMTGYMKDESGPKKPKEERVKDLFNDAEKAVADKRWTDARTALDELIRIEPSKKVNRDYLHMRAEVDKALAKPPKK